MASRLPVLVISTSSEAIEIFEGFAAALGESIAPLMRAACRQRLIDPLARMPLREDAGPRVHKLKLHLRPELKERIQRAALEAGESTSLWVESALMSAVWDDYVATMSETPRGQAELRQVYTHAKSRVITQDALDDARNAVRRVG